MTAQDHPSAADQAPESRILADVLVAVSALPGALVWRNNSGLLFSRSGHRVRASVPGAPDILGVYRGRAIGIETKTERGRQSTQQRRFQEAFERAGGLYILARRVADALEPLRAVTEDFVHG